MCLWLNYLWLLREVENFLPLPLERIAEESHNMKWINFSVKAGEIMFAISDGSRTKVKNPFQWHNLPGEPASWAYAGKKGPFSSLLYFSNFKDLRVWAQRFWKCLQQRKYGNIWWV